LIRRFYASVAVRAEEDGTFVVLLDGNRLNTPARVPLALPSRALAEAVAAEWSSQGDAVRPERMPLTRLANVAVERTPNTRTALAEQIASYGATDLLHHRADQPEELARRQAESWDPILEWAETALGLRLPVAVGILAPDRDASHLGELALREPDFQLTGLAHATALFGSAFLAFALLRGRLDAQEAFALSRVDETFQSEQWGEDPEAQERAIALAADAHAAGRFLELSRGF